MTSRFYLPRTLIDDASEYSEVELLASCRHVVVLAEPGGGKSDLLESLARQLGVTAVTANVFAQLGSSETGAPLVIDAFDELAKIDATGIHRLLGIPIQVTLLFPVGLANGIMPPRRRSRIFSVFLQRC